MVLGEGHQRNGSEAWYRSPFPTWWVALCVVAFLGTACSGDDAASSGDMTTTTVPAAETWAASPAPLPSSLPDPEARCQQPDDGSPMRVTADCTDPELRRPFIDVDEERTVTDPATGADLAYRYVHGGFTDTSALFVFYFPTAGYRGRFFQSTYPTVGQEGAGDDQLVFALTNGAYVVSSNNAGGVAASPAIGGYRVNAAAAKVSRLVAAELYGDDAPVRGYLHGASGGAYQSVGGLENTSGVWDGAVPMVPGTPNSIPSNQGVMLLGLRVLGDDLAAVADALAPGGSGDPYEGLSREQRDILEEITTLGFPPRGWWQYAELTGGSFYGVAGGVRTIDPTYAEDFWTVPGYEGADPGASVRDARIQFETTVTGVSGGTATLADAPTGDLIGVDLVITRGDEEETIPFVTVDGSEVEGVANVAPGDRVRIDNSWFLALQYLHRYQVPTEDMYGWNQFRDASGAPIYPQRSQLTGPIFAGVTGGVATGHFDGRMIVLASVMDVEAFPWSADWYRQQVEAALGDGLDDSFRLWFMDNADHTPPKNTAAEAHIVSYQGELEQALLDLDAWVADGTSPPASTSYQVTDDNQIDLPTEASARGGVQPVVHLAAGATCDDAAENVSIEVAAGDPVALSARAELPPDTGELVGVEWDFDGTGTYSDGPRLDESGPDLELCETHTYDEPGTYFAVVRVTGQRDGDPGATHGLIQNLARVRVVVT